MSCVSEQRPIIIMPTNNCTVSYDKKSIAMAQNKTDV